MKKLISIISALVICMSCTTAFADKTDAAKMQPVLESVKSRITVPEELSKFESSSETSGYSTEFHFDWRTENYEKSMHVSCYEDGTITSYSKYDGYYENKPKLSRMSAADAKAFAEDFVKKINPDYPYEVAVQNNDNASLYNSRRTFPIDISVSGVEVVNQGGSVSVDTEKGEVTDFNIWYVPDTKEYFTGPEQFIPSEDAKQAYIENFPMELVYRSYYDDDSKEIFYPVYVTTDGYNEYINGVTGEVETIDFYKTFRSTGADDFGMKEAASTADKAMLTPQELEEIGNISGLISKEDIEKQLRSNKVLSIPQNAQTENIRLAKGWHDETYHYSITLRTDNDYINADVDAKTGEIYSYYRSFDRSKDTENQNDAAFRELAGSKADEFKYDELRKQYVRYVNGIEVQGNGAYMTFSDGVLTRYNISYSDADFPSLDGVMSAEDAAAKMFEQTDYKPVCVVGYNADNEACLYPVYSLDALSINPFTGKAVDWQNNEITGEENAPLTYSDISGHWAESFIDTLAEYGIGFEGGEFKPDEKITQSDLLTLLGTIYGGGDVIVFLDNKIQADGVYSRAISKSIINEDERDDNAVLTRETASIYLIRAIGAEQYAKYNDIYVTPFDDVTENKGYIALLSAMGVVHGDGGHFNPTREITRAEFAVMLYNYLNR